MGVNENAKNDTANEIDSRNEIRKKIRFELIREKYRLTDVKD